MVNREKKAWTLFAAAVLTSLAALPLYFVGEEGIVAITSLEMWYRGDWLHLRFYGGDLQHGVFANWLIIPISALIGWDHVLAVGRAVMIASTAATGGMLFLLVRRLYQDAGVGAFAAAVYVTFADVLFYRGWLAYRDPLFGFLVFSSIAALWIGAKEARLGWLGASCAFAALAFLTKGLTAYVFAATAALVLALDSRQRAFLLRPAPLFLALITMALPVIWFNVVVGGISEGTRMTSEILSKLSVANAGAYVFKLFSYPLEVFLRLLPASFLGLWWVRRRPVAQSGWASDPVLRAGLLIGLLGFVPYWLAPQSHFRYLIPVLPLFALVLAVIIWRCGEPRIATTMKWLWAAVALKLVLAVAVFPYYQRHYRGENYAAAARDILFRTAGYPLYTQNVSASGLSVTAHLDMLRLPQSPLTFPPPQWDSGFVMAYEADPGLGQIARRYRLGGDELYLLCRGQACEAAKRKQGPETGK